jgi:hypothetical protein
LKKKYDEEVNKECTFEPNRNEKPSIRKQRELLAQKQLERPIDRGNSFYNDDSLQEDINHLSFTPARTQ